MEGILIKGYSGFYYVKNASGLWECSLRGKHRLEHQTFLPGDRVNFKVLGGGKGVIEGVLPRKNQLLRPPVANVDRVIIVIALASPQPDLYLLDRMLVLTGAEGMPASVCFNKADLVATSDHEAVKLYQELGCNGIVTSAKTGQGVQQLREVLAEGVSVMAGPSGVGKSSLLNTVQEGLKLNTGEISRKLQRGRHTTRKVELLSLDSGGLVADTPGFSRLSLPDLKREELADLFPEMVPYRNHCRFYSCLHRSEPQCVIKDAVDRGDIDRRRYQHYLRLLEEVIAQERRY